MIFVDTNVLLDIFEDAQTPEADWSRRTLAAEAGHNRLVCNLIVAAELAGQIASPDLLGDTLGDAEIELLDLTLPIAHRAGAAFREYRRRGGVRTAILPDFLVGAHAVLLDARLMTRDRGIASYFPDLSLITPETYHG